MVVIRGIQESEDMDGRNDYEGTWPFEAVSGDG